MILLRPIDPKRLVDGRVQVAHGDYALRDVIAALIARANYLARLDSRARQRQRPAIRPVIAAKSRIDDRSSAELAHRYHERRIEQTPLIQILDQSRQAAIERRSQTVAMALVVVAMRIPGVAVIARRRNEAAPCFHQPPRQQKRLSRLSPCRSAP